jgi:N-acetyl-anhydromuramyl-L-alanine amidase AmpD
MKNMQRLVIVLLLTCSGAWSQINDEVRSEIKNVQASPNRWKSIVLHHSGTSKGNAKKYNNDHLKRGLTNGLAYHFVIGKGMDSKDGQVEVGDRWKNQLKGGHLRDEKQNEQAIGICLVGNFDEDKPTAKQMKSLKELISILRSEVLLDPAPIVYHKNFKVSNTTCPGAHFPYAEIEMLNK